MIRKLFFYSAIFYIPIVIFSSCGTSKQLNGRYVSNFPKLGFFATIIKFEADSFHYNFYGDLLADEATGTFKLKRNRIYLSYNPTVVIIDSFRSSYMKEYNLPVSSLYPIKLPRPIGFKKRNDKLIVVNQFGEIIRREKKQVKRNNGSYVSRSKRYFLIKSRN